MARLNDISQNGSSRQSVDEILIPHPGSSQSKVLVASTLPTPQQLVHHAETDSASEEAQTSPRDYEYNSSASSTRHSSSDIFGREMDEELEHMKSTASSRSSTSSVPASVLIHPYDETKPTAMDAYEKVSGYIPEDDEASFGDVQKSPRITHAIRYRAAAFRKPSSVRAMQMHTEDEADEEEYLTPPRCCTGARSTGSSPLKRSPYYSPSASTSKQKVKKEYPLVLLHCNLLPPSLPVSGAAAPYSQKILEDTLPPPYWRRWKRLQEKVGSGVLRDRGILISHPADMYDILEERLLESLELQRSRLQNGHFLGHEESGPGSEGDLSDPGESETDSEQGEECPDCGARVLRHGDSNRKWEIRVYAANGLMRAGAWAAAWKEMEKVDVEVGLWLPSDVRHNLERKLSENMAAAREEPHATPMSETGMQVSRELRQPSFQDRARTVSHVFSEKPPSGPSTADFQHISGLGRQGERKEEEIALQTLLINYIRVLASDKRNVALVFLSILVAFLAIGSRHQQPAPYYSDIRPFAHDILESTTVPSMSVFSTPVSSFITRSVDVEETQPSSQTVSVPVYETAIPSTKEDINSLSDSAQSSATSINSAETTESSVLENIEPDARPVLGEASD